TRISDGGVKSLARRSFSAIFDALTPGRLPCVRSGHHAAVELLAQGLDLFAASQFLACRDRGHAVGAPFRSGADDDFRSARVDDSRRLGKKWKHISTSAGAKRVRRQPFRSE